MARRITDEKVLMERVRKMLPARIPATAIRSVECDPTDGEYGGPSYWVILAPGYIAPGTQCHVIHEDTLAQIRSEVRGIELWENDPDLDGTDHGMDW